MKKTLLFFLVLITAISLFACQKAPSDTGDFECSFDNSTMTATITAYNGSDEDVVIPSAFGKYTVTSIDRAAFSEKYEIASVTLPETLVNIGASAFELCVGIKTIEIPEGVKTIGNTAFANCRGLKEVTIPKSVEAIGICAFTGCTSLESIEVDPSNTSYSSDRYGALLDKEQKNLIQFPLGSDRKTYIMPESVKVIASYAFEKSKNIETVEFSPVLEKIESYAFQGSSIKTAVFGDSLTEIGAFCFNESKLSTLELGRSVKTLGDSAFSWCTFLGGFSIPASLESIGTSAFFMCTSISEYKVDGENKSFSSDENGVLFNKDKTYLIYYPTANTASEYIIPDGVSSISARAFSPTLNLKKVTVPDSVEAIGELAFAQCSNLTDVVYLGTPPKTIADNAFEK